MSRYTLAIVLLLAWVATANAGIHPTFPLMDVAEHETTDPAAVDAKATCGQCHDVNFIRSHSSHHREKRSVDCFRCHVPGGAEALVEKHLEEGLVKYQMESPTSAACGECHGLVHLADKPLELPAGFVKAKDPSVTSWTLRTGEIFSGQRISDSFLNLAGKLERDRPWDVHASRKLDCISCHYAANNPAKAGLQGSSGPNHLRRDPRTLATSDYIQRPDHELAAASCTACHDPAVAHPDMPFRARHMEALACQACHVPDLAGPAARVVDATVVTTDGGPRLELRGVEAPEGHPNSWYGQGYKPFLLYTPDENRFEPYNIVARWGWVDRDGAEVPDETLGAAWLTPRRDYHPEIIPHLDRDGDGELSHGELLLDTPERVAVIAGRLEALGIKGPEIKGTLGGEPIRHGVAEGRWVGGRCDSCHGQESRFNEEIPVAGALPGGVEPEVTEELAALLGDRTLDLRDDGLVLQGSSIPKGRYILGTSRAWSDTLGFLIFVLAILGVSLHGGWRYLAARRGSKHQAAPTRKEYLYNVYERLWHWVMAFSVLMLMVTGLQIHFPDGPSLFSFPTSVLVHNAMALVMLLNAFLALFYHLSTNEIRQFIPEGAGLIGRLKAQTLYYLHGIFRGAAHPTAKTRERKLNPLQQLTYVGLLNVLFPLQIGTGTLLWVAGLSPEFTTKFGGMSWITPVHNLGSWLFLTFLVVHVYLTTTGHTVLSNLRAMIDGWDEVDVAPEGADQGAER